MIDFKDSSFIKLKQVPINEFIKLIDSMLISNEQIIDSYKGIRDSIVFTNKRIITINIQGLSGKKKDFTSIPYKNIQTYSLETAGTFDLDSEFTIWISSIGKLKFKFASSSNIHEICKMISTYIL